MERFTRFVDYLGFSLTNENYAAYQDLFRSFEQFCNMNTGISQELQFIRWHRQYSSTPPTTPTTAVVTPTLLQPEPLHLPTKLATLPDQTCFNTFSLERTTQQANMEPQTIQGEPNIIEQTLLETLNSSEDENSETTFEQHEISDIIMSINESHPEPTIASQNKLQLLLKTSQDYRTNMRKKQNDDAQKQGFEAQ
ncbi:Hypothetical predicted protein, partial [Paramuricea clavata]